MDLKALTVDLACPECEFENTVSLGQIEGEEQVICVGCLSTIQLRDANSSIHNVTRDVERSLDELLKGL